MIYITQGNEKSVSIEITLKALSSLSTADQKHFILCCKKEVLEENLQLLKIKYVIKEQTLYYWNCSIKCHFVLVKNNKTSPQTCLDHCLDSATSNDLIVTNPITKDQLAFNGLTCAGHTDYFRKKFAKNEISMLFKSSSNYLLITEHIPLDKVYSQAKIHFKEKLTLTLKNIHKTNSIVDKVYVSGINPHCGEDGLISKQDSFLINDLIDLKKKFPYISFSGPISGDTLSYSGEHKDNELYVYISHDQGLSYFKGVNGLLGMNISLGLPFLRISVDHGTASDLYGLNKANYFPTLNLFNYCLKLKAT